MSKANDLMEEMTKRLIKSIEEGMVSGKWTKPWVSKHGEGFFAPINALTKKPYQGGNFLFFAWMGADAGYRSGFWATYKQWEEIGAQVRKGEKGTQGIKWVEKKCDHGKEESCSSCGQMFPSVFTVFNADQVDGFDLDLSETPEDHLNPDSRSETLDSFFASLGAKIIEGDSNQACYIPSADEIRMPDFDQFLDATYFYSTLAHETIHWSGHESRLARKINVNRFDRDAYAFEELVAELGATMLCVQLGIEDQPREDHAQYLSSWISVLNNDYKALWSASSLASKASEFVMSSAKVLVNQ